MDDKKVIMLEMDREGKLSFQANFKDIKFALKMVERCICLLEQLAIRGYNN